MLSSPPLAEEEKANDCKIKSTRNNERRKPEEWSKSSLCVFTPRCLHETDLIAFHLYFSGKPLFMAREGSLRLQLDVCAH